MDGKGLWPPCFLRTTTLRITEKGRDLQRRLRSGDKAVILDLQKVQNRNEIVQQHEELTNSAERWAARVHSSCLNAKVDFVATFLVSDRRPTRFRAWPFVRASPREHNAKSLCGDR